jgi:hypothetical protein
VAERLQANGMDVRWTSKAFRYPAIFIVKKDSQADAWLNGLEEVYTATRGWAVVVQYPTAKEAKEEAGSKNNAFAWGRFMISGDPEVVREIRSRL